MKIPIWICIKKTERFWFIYINFNIYEHWLCFYFNAEKLAHFHVISDRNDWTTANATHFITRMNIQICLDEQNRATISKSIRIRYASHSPHPPMLEYPSSLFANCSFFLLFKILKKKHFIRSISKHCYVNHPICNYFVMLLKNSFNIFFCFAGVFNLDTVWSK